MKRLIAILSGVAVMVAVSGQVQAALISFEDVSPENGATDVVSFGHNFKSGFAGWLYSPPGGSLETSFSANPHTSMRLGGSGDSGGSPKVDLPGPGVRMTRVGGGAFLVSTFEAATFSTSQASDVLTVTGLFSGGGSVSTTFDLTTSFQSFSLLGFEDLTQIDFYSTVNGGFTNDGFQIDDISTDAAVVPEPSSFAIFAALTACFFGCNWRRRKLAVVE